MAQLKLIDYFRWTTGLKKKKKKMVLFYKIIERKNVKSDDRKKKTGQSEVFMKTFCFFEIL